MITIFAGASLLAGPGLRQTLILSPEGFSSLELTLLWTGESISASLGGRWEDTGFVRGETGVTLHLEGFGLLAGLGWETGGWEASVGGELYLPPLSSRAMVSFGETGVTAWSASALVAWELLSFRGQLRWEGDFLGTAALLFFPGPLLLGAGLSFSQDVGLHRVRGEIGISGEPGVVALRGAYTPSTGEVLLTTEFDLRGEHLSVGLTAVWNPFPRGGVHPAAPPGDTGPGGAPRYLEELRLEVAAAVPPGNAVAPREGPSALISSPKGSTFTVGEEIVFSAWGSRSTVAPGLDYRWDFGDGRRGRGLRVTHSYAFPGIYRVVLEARDRHGRSARAERTLRILPPGLVADFTWEPREPSLLDDVRFIDRSLGQVVSWHWDFGDGSSSRERGPVHRYSRKGTFRVTLTVTDGYGREASVVKDVTVVNLPPIADPGGPYEGVVYQGIAFDATGSRDPDGEIVEYIWDFGDGTVGSGRTAAHAYREPGTYEVCLTVVDDDGAEATACTAAEIVPRPAEGGT